MLGARGVLFSLDAIQTLGAMPVSVEHVDFLAADAHKWMLGPLAAGIVLREEIAHSRSCVPLLLGAANVRSPQTSSRRRKSCFLDTAARYEPGVLNLGPILGMKASLDLILEVGPARGECAGSRSLLSGTLAGSLGELGFEPVGPVERAERLGHPDV